MSYLLRRRNKHVTIDSIMGVIKQPISRPYHRNAVGQAEGTDVEPSIPLKSDMKMLAAAVRSLVTGQGLDRGLKYKKTRTLKTFCSYQTCMSKVVSILSSNILRKCGWCSILQHLSGDVMLSPIAGLIADL